MSIAPWLAEAWTQLAARRTANRFPHAVLLAGPAGLGKREFASDLVAALLCRAPLASGLACGGCKACVLVAARTHPDRMVVTLEPNDEGVLRAEIVVDQIRALSARLAMRPNAGGMQVALVDPADLLNPNAANALLKTLEEPAADSVIVLVADQPSRLPATIRSRCQRVDAHFPHRDEALAWLGDRGMDAGTAVELLAIMAGNPGAALGLASERARELLREVSSDLRNLLQGRASCPEVATRWAKGADERRAARKIGMDPARDPRSDGPYADEVRVLLAAQVARLVGSELSGRETGVPTAAELARLTTGSDFPKLSAWWDRANWVRGQLRSPLRTDLILLELLRDWRALAPAAKRA
jgi:DNA polymerase-3 subunit delta'